MDKKILTKKINNIVYFLSDEARDKVSDNIMYLLPDIIASILPEPTKDIDGNNSGYNECISEIKQNFKHLYGLNIRKYEKNKSI